MQNDMELLPRSDAALTQTPAAAVSLPTMPVAEMAALKYPEAEAALSLELDRITELSREHPLEALDQILGLMQGINLELLKCYAPVLLEEAQLRSAAFAVSGKVEEPKKRGGHYMLTGFLRLQEAVAKLGVGQTKVSDELRRRAKSA